MITVTVYYREKGAEFDQLLADLDTLQAVVPHQIAVVNLDSDRALQERFGQNLPVIEIGPYRLQPPFTRQDLQIILSAARDRVNQLERVDEEGYHQKLVKGHTISSSDRLTLWLSRHYLAMVNVLLLLYIGLPFLAPVLMKTGHPFPATIIYRVYGVMCHQLAFRSWFLFGEQAYYPRELAGISNVITIETLQNTKNVDLAAARVFVGNDVVGYKVALCERDVAIYLFMLFFGICFAVFRRKFRSINWMVWIVVGLVPIGLDGFSQLMSFIPIIASWFPARESTPLLRTLTGGLFGWMTAWYLFPMLEDTAQETRQLMQRKLAVIQQTIFKNDAKDNNAIS
jgi:uncharacterized membrane protein